MKSWKRFALNLLLPAPVAATLIVAYALVESVGDGTTGARDLAKVALVIVVYAYGCAIVPSLLGALWMERLYRRGHPAASARALVHSGLCGAFSGAAIAGYFLRPFPSGWGVLGPFFVLVALGAGTGLVVGWLVWMAEKRAVLGRR